MSNVKYKRNDSNPYAGDTGKEGCKTLMEACEIDDYLGVT
jgi:hypothetical protein